MGLFPVGTLVRLNTDELAVVTAEHPTDPFRPQVKIVIDATGAMLEEPLLANTWERDGRGEHPRARWSKRSIRSRSDIDPLTYHVTCDGADRRPPTTARRPERPRAARPSSRARARPPRARCVLYPAGHPAIAATLGRIAQHHVGRPSLPEPLKITVLPDGLLLDERAAGAPRRGDRRARRRCCTAI